MNLFLMLVSLVCLITAEIVAEQKYGDWEDDDSWRGISASAYKRWCPPLVCDITSKERRIHEINKRSLTEEMHEINHDLLARMLKMLMRRRMHQKMIH